jgi:hypothetical protein
MARSITITVPPERTHPLLGDIESTDGVIGIRLDPGVSRRPPGDVITVLVTNVSLHLLLRVIDRHGIPGDPATSITLSEPAGIISSTAAPAISGDTTEIPWEEMEYTLARESNMSTNALVTMAAAGIFAAVGVAMNALHIVMAAMLIAPGFEPIVRIALGFVSKSTVWKQGLKDMAAGYAALLTGAVFASLVLQLLGRSLPSAEASYLHAGDLARYWTTFSGPTVLVAAVAGFSGAILIANNRSILTAGVMIALSLVPTMAMCGMGVVAGDLGLALIALGRWLGDVLIVFLTSLAAFAWKHRTVQQRTMMG